MTLLVRDEEDILVPNIEYHLARGVDFIIATDNLSIDRTPRILEHYRRKGVLDYVNETSDDYSQHKWVTKMARRAYQEFDADWVINNDADEFWWPEDDRSLKGVLLTVPKEVIAVSATRYDFYPRKGNKGVIFLDNMTVRRNKSASPKVCHRALSDIEVDQGNHNVKLAGHPLKATKIPFTIFHFPNRSYAHFERKAITGGKAYINNSSLNQTYGRNWQDMYRRYLSGELHELFDHIAMSDADIEQGLSEGTHLRDLRLKQFFDENLDWDKFDLIVNSVN